MSENKFKSLMVEANSLIDTISVIDAKELLNNSGVNFIDVREKHEREGKGHITGSHHAPRGFIEMIAAPDGPMHNDIFTSGKQLVLYCATGGRSALAAKTLLDMGFEQISSLSGGFAAWLEVDGPVQK